MVDTPIPRTIAEPPLREQAPHTDLLDELLWLARDAQERLAQEPLGDRGYVLGQRNTYARAAGIVAARDSNDDPAVVANRVVHALVERDGDLHAVRAAALHRDPLQPAAASLDWIGPKAFDARYGDVPGIDQDFGMCWGASGNQRLSLRRVPGSGEGMLYAYDPTWDEYALIHRTIATRAVTDVYLQALRRYEHLPLEDFARLINATQIHTRFVEAEPTVLAREP